MADQIQVTKSARETQTLGEKLSADLKNGSLVCLYGELGSGKTTFVQGVALGLGIKQRIISPTFIFIRSYKLSAIRSLLYHIDLYRIETLNDAKGLGLEEILSIPKNIVLIEWPEKIKEILPEKRTDIHFKYLNENERKITISH